MSNPQDNDWLERQIEEAIKDGLSNHTGEWFNGFIVPGLNLTEEQSRDLLFYLTKAKRLNKNIQSFISEHYVPKSEVDEMVREARVDEWQNLLKGKITHGGSPAPFNPEGLPISTPATQEMTRLLHEYAKSRLAQLSTNKKGGE